MRGALNNILTYRSDPYNRVSLEKAFSNMKSTSADPAFYTIKTWMGDLPSDSIHLHEGLVSSSAVNTCPTLATINGHLIRTLGKTEATTADELKEPIDK